MVGARGFEPATPCPPDSYLRLSAIWFSLNRSSGVAVPSSGQVSGLRDLFQRVGSFRVQNVCAPRRRFQVGMIWCALNQFEVSGTTQQYGRQIVAQIMEPQPGHAGLLAQTTPYDLRPRIGKRITLSPRPSASRSFGDRSPARTAIKSGLRGRRYVPRTQMSSTLPP